jgi:hypothetical protein
MAMLLHPAFPIRMAGLVHLANDIELFHRYPRTPAGAGLPARTRAPQAPRRRVPDVTEALWHGAAGLAGDHELPAPAPGTGRRPPSSCRICRRRCANGRCPATRGAATRESPVTGIRSTWPTCWRGLSASPRRSRTACGPWPAASAGSRTVPVAGRAARRAFHEAAVCCRARQAACRAPPRAAASGRSGWFRPMTARPPQGPLEPRASAPLVGPCWTDRVLR